MKLAHSFLPSFLPLSEACGSPLVFGDHGGRSDRSTMCRACTQAGRGPVLRRSGSGVPM
ncbi:hypothetical protein PR003_g21315 [Phytophthora rubi]|uniref:Uncharacterized protein n=1 Tax=Phytophthora rubi TaxID=129364 RepID=A0A6A3J4Y0_9STRA|nr:hypothetical protein PR001_g21526 [Phytophthora rubi]KAE9306157.1 hypothetical protein PR003_g21315 [Phytophthora rubi]